MKVKSYRGGEFLLITLVDIVDEDKVEDGIG